MTDTEDQKSFLTVHRDPPVSAHPDALDYDPNYFADAKNVVRLTLGSWRHRGYVLVTLSGPEVEAARARRREFEAREARES